LTATAERDIETEYARITRGWHDISYCCLPVEILSNLRATITDNNLADAAAVTRLLLHQPGTKKATDSI
jgi:hypothetical protein